ncbi:hypothetical protein B0T42_13160 [Rathayibacter sp. VKM Ac-2630]|nr:hypothetical protein B0T42_13160 [Rathayibacter sp. VKM Ac-2630]
MATERRGLDGPSPRIGSLPALGGVALTLRGWAFVVLGTAAIVAAPLVDFRELLFLGLVLLGLPFGAVVSLAVSTPVVQVQRRFEPRVVAVGDVVDVDVVLENRGGPLRSARAEDRLTRRDRGEDSGRSVASGGFGLPPVAAPDSGRAGCARGTVCPPDGAGSTASARCGSCGARRSGWLCARASSGRRSRSSSLRAPYRSRATFSTRSAPADRARSLTRRRARAPTTSSRATTGPATPCAGCTGARARGRAS